MWNLLAGFLAIILAIILIGGAVLAPIILPTKLVPDAYSDRELTKDENDKIHLQIDTRKSVIDWLQIIFGAATATGLIGTLFYTARSYRVASENLRVTEYSKFSEAYLKWVELLGSNNQNTVVGTVHALGRLALSSCHDHRHIMTVLCDYVRRAAPHKINSARQGAKPAEIKPEVQAVLDVFRIRKTDWENAQNALNLSGTCLCGGYLVGANLRYAILEDCDLRGANLRGADLQYAKLSGTLLNDTAFDGANLRGANLQNTNLDNARLVSVRLNCTTNLKGAGGTVIGTHTRRSRRQQRESGLHWI